MRKIMILLSAACIAVMLAGSASAYVQIGLDPGMQGISVGTTGVYNVVVKTTDSGAHTIEYDTLQPLLLATLEGGPQGASATSPAQTGSINWDAGTLNGVATYFTFTYKVTPQVGILALGSQFSMTLDDTYAASPVHPSVRVMPELNVPEFPTIALPVAAILGLVFLFQRRKEE